MFILAGLSQKLLKKILQCAAEGRIDDSHLTPPQSQDLPDGGADVVHIHLLYDPARFDLSLKSIAQSTKFIGRFGDKQGATSAEVPIRFFDAFNSLQRTHSRPRLVLGNASALARPLSESLADPPQINAVNRRGRNSSSSAAVEAQTVSPIETTSADPR